MAGLSSDQNIDELQQSIDRLADSVNDLIVTNEGLTGVIQEIFEEAKNAQDHDLDVIEQAIQKAMHDFNNNDDDPNEYLDALDRKLNKFDHPIIRQAFDRYQKNFKKYIGDFGSNVDPKRQGTWWADITHPGKRLPF